MALTRLDNLISSKTGKYLYVSPDDFNASDELNNRGNSPIRPFKSIQRAFIEISRYSYQPGPDNDRFDQFTVMVMPGKHYVDNRPGLASTDGIDAFTFDQALGEWADSSNLDISDPNNKLYLFNNTEGGAIIPRGSSIIGYDLRRTSVHPLFVPDPADRLEKRSAIFNVTGGCYFWQFTIRDGDLEPSSPLYDSTDGVGKVYYQNGQWDQLAVPNFSHHKLTVFEYADKEELGLYYQKVAKAFSQYQPTIDDPREFGDRIEETRIVGPLSDIRAIESIKCTDSSPAGTITVEVTSKVNHGYFKNQFVAIESNGLDDQLNGTFGISGLDLVDKRKFSYQIPGTVSALGTINNLVSGTTYTTANGLNSNAVVKAEVDSVESASPYVFNCSIRSTWGICGIWANGLKATGFKSMVIAQYTGVSLQKDDRAFIRYDEFTNTFNQASLTDAFATVPYHTKGDAFWKDDWRNFHVRASEDAFIQCVSIFAVGFADHFLMESGGDMSITNSNSNFGNTSLHAIGHKGYAFNQDKGGYITDIVPPQEVVDSVGNTTKQSYYTLDVYASNDISNHTKVFLGDDEAYNPSSRPAATIGGYRVGAKTDDKLFVKLQPRSAGANTEYHATISPSGFKKFTAAADILNPSGVTINNQTLDAADRIEANKDFIAHEAYDYILAKYPTLKIKEGITIEKCRRDVGYLIDATVQDLRLGGNVNTIQAAESYFVASQLSYITGELNETLEGYNYARDVAIAAMRNFTYLRNGVSTSTGSAIVNIGDTSGVVEGMTVADYDPSQFTSGKLNDNAQRPSTPVIPDNTFVKKVIDSTSIELGDNTQTAEKKVASDRHGNARELILANKDFIANEAYERMLLDFPNYTPSTGYTLATSKVKCLYDLGKVVEAVAENTGYGGNAETWDAAYHYESGAVVDLEDKKEETLAGFNYAKDMAIQVMRKENVFVYGTHGLTQSSSTASDPITDDPSPELVSDRNGDARNLILSNKNLIAHEAVERMVLNSSTQQYTPTNATYDPATGNLTLTSDSHGLAAATEHTVTGAVYTPTDGNLVLTVPSHGFTNGQKVLIKDNSLVLNCAMDSGSTEHSYPRSSDPVSGKWLTISNKSTDQFTVNVGTSPLVKYTPTTGTTYNPDTGILTLKIGNHNLRGSTTHKPSAADYNPTTGVMVLTIANHGLSIGDKIKINDNSLSFSCQEDNNATNHSYPRPGDPVSGQWLEISNITKDTFEVTVLTTLPSTNATPHLFQGALDNAVIVAGESVRIADGGLKFTCAKDNNATEHAYPRSTDPFYNTAIPIESATVDTITLIVGKAGDATAGAHTFVEAITGALETGGSYTHSYVSAVGSGLLAQNDSVRIDYDALKFTCGMDNNATQHSYPRISDPAASSILPVIASTPVNFTVNVGKTLDVSHNVTDAIYTPSTGDLTLTLNDHNLIKGQTIRIADESLTFTCSKDSNATQHQYPRNETIDLTPTDAGYDPTTGILTFTLANHGLEKDDMIQVAQGSLTFTCKEDDHQTPHQYPRAGDPLGSRYTPVFNVTTDTFDIQVLDNAPSTNTSLHICTAIAPNAINRFKDRGWRNALEITKVGSSFHTITDASYTPKDGILEITVPNHGLTSDSRVKLTRDALTFKCAMDNYATEHSYPRESDPADGKWLDISDVTSNTFKVNVGLAGSDQKLTPTDATYDPSSGELVLTVGSHNLSEGDGIVIDNESLTFTCAMDGDQVPQSYPRAGVDKASSRSLHITSVTDTTISVNVGSAGTNKTFTPSAASYDEQTGEMVLTIGQHGISVGSDITLKDNSLAFTCDKDNNSTQHKYPRPGTDPYATKSIRVDAVGSTKHTVTDAVYTPTDGKMIVTVAGHGFSNNDYVKFADNSIRFSCTLDGNATNKAYPRNDFDQNSGRWLQISNVQTDTFEVNVGLSSDTSIHTFVDAVNHGLERQDGTVTINVGSAEATAFEPTSADYDPTTGDMVLTMAGHGLSNGQHIRVAKESLIFTCAEDNNATEHSYPRATDKLMLDGSAIVKDVTTDTVTIGVLQSWPSTNTTDHVFVGLNKFLTAGGASYNAATGYLTITSTGHGLLAGERVKLNDNSIRMTCAMDGNVSEKTYPRSTDPISGKFVPIFNVTADTFDIQVGKSLLVHHTPTGASYNPTTGLMELTIGAHNYTAGDNVKIAKESLIFTCGQDANTTEHAYPRSSDPFYDKAFVVEGVTATTITVQVLDTIPSSNTTTHTFVTALPNAITAGGNYSHSFVDATPNGITRAVVLSGDQYTHTFVPASTTADAVEYSPQSVHTFVSAKTECVKHYPDQTHQFVRGATNGLQKQGGTITVNVGASPVGEQHTHTFISADNHAVTSGGLYDHTFVGAVSNSVHKIFSVAGNRSYHNVDCIDDVRDLLEAIADNVAYGGNDKTWDAAYSYKTGAHVAGEETETNVVFEHAKEMAAQVIKNQKILSIGSHGLAQTYDTTITFDTNADAPVDKNGDAYNLIIANADLIAHEAYARMILNNVGFLPPTGNKQDCIDDIRDFVVEIAHNVGFGGNDRVWDMANLYVTGAHVAGEEDQTIEAFKDATQLIIQAMRNERILKVSSNSLTQTFDTSITSSVAPPQNNKVADAVNLISANKNFIAEVAMGRMISQYPSYQPPTGYAQSDCVDDLKDIVDVIAHNIRQGGNDRTWDTANLYVGGAVQAINTLETVYAIEQARDIIKEVATNVTVTSNNYTSLTQTKDTTITDGVTNGDCNTVLSSVDTLVTILTNAISTPTSLASVTRTASTYKCTTVESTINTLSTIAQNAITDPASLSGSRASVSTATYAQVSGLLELTIGTHSYKVGESVSIPNESLIFTCAKDGNTTEHRYPRATDPMGTASSNITAVSATSITVDVGAGAAIDQYAHTFVSATDDITVGGVKRTRSAGRCNNIRSTIDTLFKIVTDTITTPTSLNNVTRNISNGKCQNVASTITTLFSILTNTIQTNNYLNSIERTESPTGLSTGNPVNADATTNNTYLYFTLPSGRYTTAYSPVVDDTITQDNTYPQCNDVANQVRQYFANINTIIQTGLGAVTRNQPSNSSDLSSRATVFTLGNWTPGPLTGSNPHELETGTAVRLVPRPRYDRSTNQYVEVDKRNVRLPNGFDTNTKYYVIAPGRNTQPENYAGSTTFNGTDQTKLMLASSKENAAAGIYIHSAEVDAIHPDIEIDIYQFVLDDKYDLHEYKCVLDSGAGAIQGGIKTDVPHIFDVQNSTVEPHKVFFRKNESGSLPIVNPAQASDPDIADSNDKLRGDKFFYARYQNFKVFTIHKTHADAIANTNPIIFQSGSYDFTVFADKRESPMRYDPTFANAGTTPVIYGKWYLQVKNESESGTPSYDAQSILARFHESTYSDTSGNNKTNDSWYERLKDERPADDRIYRLRYVIPKYLRSVRDPLNGFTIKMRKDDTRKLLPQKLMLKPVSGSVTQAKFYNTPDSGQGTEIIGYDASNFDDVNLNLDLEKAYDPYKKDTSGTRQYAKSITTKNTYVDMTIESAKFVSGGTELTVVNPRIENIALKNETFTTVEINEPQGDDFVENATSNIDAGSNSNKVTWSGNSSGYGYIHAVINVPNTTTWHLILKGVSGDIKYSSTDNIRFSQGSAFADLKNYPDYGKSLVLKDLIKEELPEYYYRQNGAKVYTITPGDRIVDDANIEFYVESVEDVGEIDDTFYIFDVEEIQRRIFDQQDGIFYITAIRGNMSPYPTGAGNQKNFHKFKFSQPVSKLYPLNYKNDPLWFKQVDPNAVDPPATYSAADNYVHGLVTVNDFKGSSTKESVIDILHSEALKNNTYDVTVNQYDRSNKLQAQKGNASAGSEDRLIPIAGDNTVVSQQRLYVELRRPSIARAGNHTFEYLGFGPGNYSTGFPARQEVLLSAIQDFYSQSKKQDGGLVFYTGLNSNGDLYIGNRKIDAITGEEEFLEKASLQDSADADDAIGDLVTTFDTPVTFNEYITVNGGENNDKPSTFNSPVTINVGPEVRDTTLGDPNKGLLTSLKITSNVSNTKDDITLDRTAQTKNRSTNGDIILAGNKVASSIFEWNPRGSNGSGQGYKILTHCVGSSNVASNITPDQAATYSSLQAVGYGAGGAPLSGDILLKGSEVGRSGSWGWILASAFVDITGNVWKLTFNNTNTITVSYVSGVSNSDATPGGVEPGMEIRISGITALPEINGTWIINTGLSAGGSTMQFNISPNDAIAAGDLSFPTGATMEVAASGWKEIGVVGAETLRTDTQTIGQYKLGVNTVARSPHTAYANAFVSNETDPRANLDVVGNTHISGYLINDYNSTSNANIVKTETPVDDALLVGFNGAQGNFDPEDAATFRVSTTNSGRVGVNTTKAEMQSAFTVKGTSEFTDNAVFQKDIEVNGGGPGSSNDADVTTTITDGTFNFVMDTGFLGLTTGTRPAQGLKIGGSVQNIEIGDVTQLIQDIKIGNKSVNSNIYVGDTPDGTGNNISRTWLGGAYESNEDNSFINIGTASFRMDGDAWLGFRRQFGTARLSSQASKIEFFANSGGPSIIDFATFASEINIAGSGGRTKVNNQLEVVASAKFHADIHLCGGTSAFEFTGTRGQLGSAIAEHTAGGGATPPKDVDILNVITKSSGEDGYNELDAWGGNEWGTSYYQNAQTGLGGNPITSPQDLPALTGDEYWLPLQFAPNNYFATNDYIIINSAVETTPRHPEIVQIVELTRTTVFPYVLKVKRQPFGTFTAALDNHKDNTPIYKVNVQFDATWITDDLDDDSSATDNIDLAEFGGGLNTGDYIIVDRDPATPSVGEVIGVQTLLSLIEQKFRVSNCDTPDVDMFVVNSVTGDTYIGGDTIMNGGLRLDGGCDIRPKGSRFENGIVITGDIAPDSATSGTTTKITGISDTSNLRIGDVVHLNTYSDSQSIIVYTDTRISEVDNDSIKLSRFINLPAAVNDVQFRISSNETFVINDGHGGNTLEFDTCIGSLELNNQNRRIEVKRVLPSTETVANTVDRYETLTDDIRVYSYWLDPKTINPSNSTTDAGPNTTLTALPVAGTGSMAGEVHLIVESLGREDGKFATDDLIIVGVTADIVGQGLTGQKFEIMKVVAVEDTTKKIRAKPAQEGTTARPLTDYPAVTSSVMRILKHPETSGITDIANRTRVLSGVNTEYVSLIIDRGYIVQQKQDYTGFLRFVDTRNITGKLDDQWFFVVDSLFGNAHQLNMNEFTHGGTLGGSGDLTIGRNFEMIGGGLTIYDSVRNTKLLSFTNDDGHADHLGLLYLNGDLTARGNMSWYSAGDPESIGAYGVLPTLSVNSLGEVVAGTSVTIRGEGSTAPTAVPQLSLTNLGVNGVYTYDINKDASINAYGIDNFITRTGGTHTRYIATGAEESATYLIPNITYMVNVETSDEFVVYLPANPITGDTVNIIDVGGNLTYNTSLIVRAQGIGTRVQGDSTGTILGGLTVQYPSGELVVQTPNAAFTLIYLGGVDSNGGVVGGSASGWWLKEV